MDFSDRAHSILDAAAAELRDLGMDPPAAPFRMLAWASLDMIREVQAAPQAREDLVRLRTMLDKHIAEIDAE